MQIRFTADVGNYKKGESVELEDSVAQPYIECSVAEMEGDECEIDKAVDKIVDKFDKRLEARMKSRPSSPAMLPAQVKDKTNGINSFGEFLQVMAKSARGDYDASQRMRLFQKSPAGANEGTSADGGYLVPQEWSNMLYDKMRGDDLFLLDYCNKTPTKRLTYNFPIVNDTSRATGSRPLRYYPIGEGNNFTSSKAVYGNVQTTLTKFGVLTYVTSEELADNAYGLESKLSDFATSELRFAFNDQIVNGDGSGQNQTGILNSACLVTVSKESGQASQTINFTNLKKMWGRLAPGSKNKAVWLINPYAQTELISLAIDPNANDKSSAYGLLYDVRDPIAPLKLFGRPVVICEQCAALGATGDIILADLGAMGCAYHEIDVAVSPHVNFVSDEIAYRFSVRFALKALWSAAMTPFKGNQTFSPFVTLESVGTS